MMFYSKILPINASSEEVKNIDDMLKNLPMSEVFGGTKVAK